MVGSETSVPGVLQIWTRQRYIVPAVGSDGVVFPSPIISLIPPPPCRQPLSGKRLGLDRNIVSLSLEDVCCCFTSTVNSYGHVGTTLLMGRLRPPKQLTTTALLESAEGETKICGRAGYQIRGLWLLIQTHCRLRYAVPLLEDGSI